MCKRLMDAAHLLDTWEVLNHNVVEYSYIRANTASRLDRILVSKALKQQIRTAHFAVTSFADHKAYVIRIALPNLGTPIGRGVWRLQPHILNNQTVLDLFARKWLYWVRSRAAYNSWLDWWLNHAKPKAISFLKWQTGLVYQDFQNTMELYRGLLRNAYNNYYGNAGQLTVINHLKAQMLRHQRTFSNNFRQSNETFISGEPTTLFHVAQMQGRKAKTTITSLETADGNELTELVHISEEVRSFFVQLYNEPTGEQVSEDFQPAKTIPLNCHANDTIMRPITTDEILLALKMSSPRKSPGSDGLPKEFYVKTWSIINTEFTLIVNDALQGRACQKFFDGVIVLVKKKGRDKTVKGYRPISLLNCDYKIFSSIMKQRLHELLPLVLSKHQKCSNGKKSIFEATSSILDRLSYLKHRRQSAMLVSFDFDHAFDRVNLQFLKETMLRMNINPEFVNLLSTIWNQCHSKIIINGHLTQEFKIQRSVRQGDPLSMLLFVIYLQPLIDAIMNRLPGSILNAYADDISMFVDRENTLIEVVEIFAEFGLSSGAILNTRKTVAVMIGHVNLTTQTEWLTFEDNIDILGVTFGENINQARKLNWEKTLRNLKTRLWLNNPRKLNLIQKIILINTYISSKIWYMASSIAITAGFANKIRTEYGKFLWHGQPLQRVAFANLVLPKERGGLNLHCPTIKCKSLLINRLATLVDQLPFLRSFLTNQAVNVPSFCSHITLVKNEMSQLPDAIRNAVSSHGIYQYQISILPDPGFVSANDRDWKTIFRTLHSRLLPSDQRSNWYLIMHKKIKHRELLFMRNASDDPFCESCPGEPETISHKLFNCQHVRDIWRFQRRQLILHEHYLTRYEPEDFIYPNLRNISRQSKEHIVKALSKYFQYIVETSVQNLGLDHFIFFISIN